MVINGQTIVAANKLRLEKGFPALINPLNEDWVRPVSYTLTCSGNNASEVIIPPGVSKLIRCHEDLFIPTTVAATIHNTVFLLDKGAHVLGPVLHPGWTGPVHLLVVNAGPWDVTIRPGSPLAALVFHRLDVPMDAAAS